MLVGEGMRSCLPHLRPTEIGEGVAVYHSITEQYEQLAKDNNVLALRFSDLPLNRIELLSLKKVCCVSALRDCVTNPNPRTDFDTKTD